MSDQLSRGDVRHGQRFLERCGLDTGRADGIWGPKTDAAVREFDVTASDLADQWGLLPTDRSRNHFLIRKETRDGA